MSCPAIPPSDPLFIPAVVVRYALADTEAMLADLRKRQDEIQGDAWPDDYDPNDIGVYESLLPELRRGVDDGYEEVYWWGKPVQWMMSGLRGLLKKRVDIPSEDRVLIVRILCEYYLRKAFWCWESPFVDVSERDWKKQKERAVSYYTKEQMELIAALTHDFKVL